MTGNVNPLLVLVSLCTAAVGIAGLVYETRRFRAAASHHPEGGVRAPRE
jgi:hypothetical protein